MQKVVRLFESIRLVRPVQKKILSSFVLLHDVFFGTYHQWYTLEKKDLSSLVVGVVETEELGVDVVVVVYVVPFWWWTSFTLEEEFRAAAARRTTTT